MEINCAFLSQSTECQDSCGRNLRSSLTCGLLDERLLGQQDESKHTILKQESETFWQTKAILDQHRGGFLLLTITSYHREDLMWVWNKFLD